jgi:hypothetical protein
VRHPWQGLPVPAIVANPCERMLKTAGPRKTFWLPYRRAGDGIESFKLVRGQSFLGSANNRREWRITFFNLLVWELVGRP